ncbi:peptidase C15, pyroglutamyl peptidase I-like protein [Massarina eburnea CBS 473.64]|uniref:Peptidase C15, pyroglutamyl peptidase I-like protein n=1 Tax=Massarina eburnea CBS 473.64 TaxID=1395130 RepID=A0A6A6RHJ9_9PLEO|nr:peptidase C15, pyroglutamyl peptidase I-like protein [Massarina eburnea CBS 473.64]
MTDSNSPAEVKVLVTGFGPFLDITTNPSWEIALNLPTTLASPNGTPIKLVVPDTYIPAAYHKIFTQTTALIDQHNPDIVVHMGLAVDRDYFAIEQSAPKEGYHEFPDVERKVFTRAENKKTFGKAPDQLATSFDLDSVVTAWQDACSRISFSTEGGKEKGKVKGKQARKTVDVRYSNDVGTYVCGFMYYVSLLEMDKRKKARHSVFLHVPKLERKEATEVGVEVTKRAIEALVGEWEKCQE